MPDDYYVSQYSGEEIDALLGSAGAGAVRYDAAQTLTDAQKTQARANIAAAPDGYGLGSEYSKAVTNWDDAKESGIYRGPAPSGIGSGTIIGVTFSDSIGYKVQIIYPDGSQNCSAQREMPVNGIWTAWEWVNPPLYSGVEYRTTERYLGKPVYVKLVNCGSAPSNSLKKFDTGLDYTVIDRRLTPTGNMYANSNDNFSIPCESTNIAGENLHIVHGTYVDSNAVRHDAVFIYTTSTTLTGYTVYVVLKYTKTTD